jgi:putative transposase
MSGAVSPVTSPPYGLAAVGRVWGVPRAIVYRHRGLPRMDPPRHRGPVGPMPDPVLPDAIRGVLADSPFHGEGHRKVWAEAGLKVPPANGWWKGQRRAGCASVACGLPSTGCCG